MKVLVKIKHGSHLYGTSTPASDVDYKGVHIPSANRILMQNANKTLDRGIKLSDSLKNTKDDIDDQSYPLLKFLDMLMAGDTVATEILFAPPEMIVEQSPEWKEVQKVGKALLNRQCRGFVGYCQRQAAKYGIKGSRMAAVKALVDLLEPYKDASNMKVETIATELEAFAASQEFASVEDIPSGHGKVIRHLECVDRKVPYTATLKEAYGIYNKVWVNYGERARAAMDNEGIDWKAISHAVRVANQAIELLETAKITFPRPEAALLLKIKKGETDYKITSKMLETLVQQVEDAAITSKLPEESNVATRDGCITYYYSKAVLEVFGA